MIIIKKYNLSLKVISIFLFSIIVGTLLFNNAVYAKQLTTIEKINIILEKIDVERNLYGDATDESIQELEELISKVQVSSELTRGYGQWHDLGKGWKARVDRPTSGAGQAKPHVHVRKGGTEGVESVDGSKSHGQTLGQAGVPKDIQKKARNLNDYKKGQKDLANMKKAKSQMNAKGLNLRKAAHIVIAIGIFIAVVGFAIFATSAVSAWGAFLLLI